VADQQRRGRESVIPRQYCPACLTELNRATHPTRRVAPKPGDLNVCIECASVCMYDPDLTLRELDAGERQARRRLTRKPGATWCDSSASSG